MRTLLIFIFLLNCLVADAFFFDEVKSSNSDTIVMNAEMYFLTGTLSMEKEDWEEAITYFESALEYDYKDHDIYAELALAHSHLGQYDQAKRNCFRGISKASSYGKYYQYLATIHGLENNLDSSAFYYKQLVARDEKSGIGYFGLANIRTIEEDYNAALIYAKKAMELFEKSNSVQTGDSQYLVGILYYYKEEDHQAKKYLELAKKNGVKLEEHLEELLTSMKDTIVLKTAEDFKTYEENVSLGVDYLMTSPADKEIKKRTEICAFIIQWVSGAPDVRVTVTQKLVPYMSYGDAMVIYLGSWADFCIQGGDCEDKVAACLEATINVIDYYEMNKVALGKNKALRKMARRNKKNKLEKYIEENLK